MDRRGTMYDPLVVDTFLRVHEQLRVEPLVKQPLSELELIAMTGRSVAYSSSSVPTAGLTDIAASTEEMLVLYDLARSLLGRMELADAADIISKHLRRIVPASTCVIFLYDVDRDELVAEHASGDSAPHFVGLRIPRGQRLTGWVAANKQSIVNSDPVLDLGESSRHFRPSLKSCLSTPLLSGSKLVGVLSVYSTIAEAFSDDHRRLIEVIARQVSETIRQVTELEATTMLPRDDVQGLPPRERVERFVAAELDLASQQAHLSIIRIQIARPVGVESRQGRTLNPAQGSHLVPAIKRVLRGADVLFRYSESEFIVVLTQTDSTAAAAVANRVAEILGEVQPGAVAEPPQTIFGVASAPADGRTLAELVVAAAQHRWSPTTQGPSWPPGVH
jgi:GGDEF domain-containing protein/putative methionine-R-sulfoxide reductase with GAF domain